MSKIPQCNQLKFEFFGVILPYLVSQLWENTGFVATIRETGNSDGPFFQKGKTQGISLNPLNTGNLHLTRKILQLKGK